jgi:HAD superfamily hydrolase (TIGR01509 family)
MPDTPDTPATRLPDPLAVVFDLDGTLVDTVERRIEAWIRTFREHGIRSQRSFIAPLIGSDGRLLARKVAQADGRTLTSDEAEEIDRRSGEIFNEIEGEPVPLAGVVPLLESLHASRLHWGIATSSRAEQVTPSVEALGLTFRPTITDGSNVEHAKPAPDLLFHAADQLGVAANRTWYVGDATWDMLAAGNAGMVGVGIATGAATEIDLRAAGAQVTWPTLDGLRAELERRGLLADEPGAG